jgi:basic amino acid/polyamine antiporter, APA family
VLVDYVGRWWSGLAEGLGRAAFIIAIWAAFAVINILGIKRAIRVLGGFTLLKTLPLIIVAATALILLGPPPSPTAPTSMDRFEAGFLIIFYAFVGFENAVLPAGETRNPRLSLPRAILATTLLTAALYFLVQLAFVTVFAEAPAGSAPLVDLGEVVAGPIGAVVLTLAAICSLLGNLLAGTAATPRITYAMGERGDLPRWFAAVNARLASPANSIAFLVVIVTALAITGSFIWLAVVSTLARLIIYVATIAALPLAENRPKLTALHWLGGAAGIAICVWGASQAGQKAWITLAALAAAGLLLYLAALLSASPRRV